MYDVLLQCTQTLSMFQVKWAWGAPFSSYPSAWCVWIRDLHGTLMLLTNAVSKLLSLLIHSSQFVGFLLRHRSLLLPGILTSPATRGQFFGAQEWNFPGP